MFLPQPWKINILFIKKIHFFFNFPHTHTQKVSHALQIFLFFFLWEESCVPTSIMKNKSLFYKKKNSICFLNFTHKKNSIASRDKTVCFAIHERGIIFFYVAKFSSHQTILIRMLAGIISLDLDGNSESINIALELA